MSAQSEREAKRHVALAALTGTVPYIRFLGIQFERRGDELTAIMRYSDRIVGNPAIPAIHGGAMGAFMETAAVVQLAWDGLIESLDAGDFSVEQLSAGDFPPPPRTVGITVDYLRSGQSRDTFARAIVQRRGRRVANVRVEAWQESRNRLIASMHGNFSLPRNHD